jgi:hypothetical protein
VALAPVNSSKPRSALAAAPLFVPAHSVVPTYAEGPLLTRATASAPLVGPVPVISLALVAATTSAPVSVPTPVSVHAPAPVPLPTRSAAVSTPTAVLSVPLHAYASASVFVPPPMPLSTPNVAPTFDAACTAVNAAAAPGLHTASVADAPTTSALGDDEICEIVGAAPDARAADRALAGGGTVDGSCSGAKECEEDDAMYKQRLELEVLTLHQALNVSREMGRASA